MLVIVPSNSESLHNTAETCWCKFEDCEERSVHDSVPKNLPDFLNQVA